MGNRTSWGLQRRTSCNLRATHRSARRLLLYGTGRVSPRIDSPAGNSCIAIITPCGTGVMPESAPSAEERSPAPLGPGWTQPSPGPDQAITDVVVPWESRRLTCSQEASDRRRMTYWLRLRCSSGASVFALRRHRCPEPVDGHHVESVRVCERALSGSEDDAGGEA